MFVKNHGLLSGIDMLYHTQLTTNKKYFVESKWKWAEFIPRYNMQV